RPRHWCCCWSHRPRSAARRPPERRPAGAWTVSSTWMDCLHESSQGDCASDDTVAPCGVARRDRPPVPAAPPRIAPRGAPPLSPVARPGKIVAVGKNYLDHVREMGGTEATEEPVLFMKPPSALIGDGDA